jgi:transcriptional regulator with XRE-family HTH domain
MANAFGPVLKEWRGRRRVSQLELSLAANISARHIAFLETGRARPSRAMVMHLGEALDMPRTERNRMLDAAGFRPAWSARRLDDEDMQAVRLAIDRLLERHDPYPAFVIDRHWNIVTANRSGSLVLSAFGLGPGGSMLEAMLEPGRAAALIDNWPEVCLHMIARLRTESAHLGGDKILDDAAAALSRDPALTRTQPADMPAVIPARYRLGGQVFSVFTTIAQFGTAEDIALADLRVELLFPADEETRRVLEGMG